MMLAASVRSIKSYNQLQKYLRHSTIFWLTWALQDLVLVTPLHPLAKITAIQDHAQNLEEQLWMEGKGEVEYYISQTCD